MEPQYQHTQKSPWYLIGIATAAALLVAGWACRDDPTVVTPLWGVAAALIIVGFCFASLTVRDVGEYLDVRFGPLGLVGTRIAYAEITGVEAARSTILDGWGIHWAPGRGWMYNVWGFDCVRITLRAKVVRIGTDDLEGLLAFLNSKLAAGGPSA